MTVGQKEVMNYAKVHLWNLTIRPIQFKLLLQFPNVASSFMLHFVQARAQSARARRACALRALGLLLADGTPTVGGGKTF